MQQSEKIITLPAEPHQHQLEVIHNTLRRSVLLHPKVIQDFETALKKISSAIKNQPHLKSKANKEHHALITSLYGRGHHLRVRKEVIDLAENAQELAHNAKALNIHQVQKLAKKLQRKVDIFTKNHKTSRINAKFLRFANNCLEKARNHKVLLPTKNSNKILDFCNFQVHDVSDDEYQLAQDLYILAESLYNNKIKEFHTLLKKLNPSVLKELRYHTHTAKGSLQRFDTKKLRMNTVRSILGYAHTITDYYTSSSAYPSDKEIQEVFAEVQNL